MALLFRAPALPSSRTKVYVGEAFRATPSRASSGFRPLASQQGDRTAGLFVCLARFKLQAQIPASSFGASSPARARRRCSSLHFHFPCVSRDDAVRSGLVLFFVGLHMPCHASRFARCMISVNRLRRRVSGFRVREWMLDSGAFSELSRHGAYRSSVAEYAGFVRRWAGNGKLVAAVSQDYMCEASVVARTGLSVPVHQALTIGRYCELALRCPGVPVMPVLQGWLPSDYGAHVEAYGSLLARGALVGVGSVCRRSSVAEVEGVVREILRLRPDLRLHLFGVKILSFASSFLRSVVWSSDSAAWCFRAWRHGGSANDPLQAAAYVRQVARILKR